MPETAHMFPVWCEPIKVISYRADDSGGKPQIGIRAVIEAYASSNTSNFDDVYQQHEPLLPVSF